MKRFLILLCLVCAVVMSQAQETYRFHTDAPQGFSIISSNTSGVTLHYSIQEIGIANIDHGEAKGQEIMLKGQFAPNAEGRPNLPVVNRYVAVPQGAKVQLQIKEKAFSTLNDIDLLPAMPIRTDFAEGLPPMRRDSAIYG